MYRMKEMQLTRTGLWAPIRMLSCGRNPCSISTQLWCSVQCGSMSSRIGIYYVQVEVCFGWLRTTNRGYALHKAIDKDISFVHHHPQSCTVIDYLITTTSHPRWWDRSLGFSLFITLSNWKRALSSFDKKKILSKHKHFPISLLLLLFLILSAN